MFLGFYPALCFLQVMYEAIQKLDEKFELLQARVTHTQEDQIHVEEDQSEVQPDTEANHAHNAHNKSSLRSRTMLFFSIRGRDVNSFCSF